MYIRKIDIGVCVCVCACVCERERERERESSNVGERHPSRLFIEFVTQFWEEKHNSLPWRNRCQEIWLFFSPSVCVENVADGNAAFYKSSHTFPGFDAFFFLFLVMFQTKRSRPCCAVASTEDFVPPLSCYVLVGDRTAVCSVCT